MQSSLVDVESALCIKKLSAELTGMCADNGCMVPVITESSVVDDDRVVLVFRLLSDGSLTV